MQSLPLCLGGISIPDSETCGEDALYQSSVGLGERAIVQSSFPEQPNEVKPLLGFFHCGCGVKSPTQELVDSFRDRVIDVGENQFF